MNRKLTVLLAVLLSIIMIVANPISSQASNETASPSETFTSFSAHDTPTHSSFDPVIEVNPLFADAAAPEDLIIPEPAEEPLVGDSSAPVATTIEEFCENYRTAFDDMVVSHGSFCCALYKCSQTSSFTSVQISELYNKLQEYARANRFIHSGVPTAGDYAKWNWYQMSHGGERALNSDGTTYTLTISIETSITYYINDTMEAELTARFNEVMNSLDLDSKTEYEKVKAIYDYITSNVTYDWEHVDDRTYLLKQTTYAALVQGTAVCQGFATLFYRMALAAGLDARIMTGVCVEGSVDGHAWNIVRLDGLYYNLDVTWDYGCEPQDYEFFLKSYNSDDFPEHIRDEEFDTADFHTEYPMATRNYLDVNPDLPNTTPILTPIPTPTPTAAPSRKQFSDVTNPTHPYYTAIYWAVDKEITKGYPGTTLFGINDSCTRSQAMMFLWRMAGKPNPYIWTKNPFSDITATHPHYKAVMWASSYGITKGFPDGTFGVDVACTRGQIMTFIWRYAGEPSPKSSKNPFKDKMTPAYRIAILWGSEKGITKGYSDGTFRDSIACTRGQIVTFLYRIRS